MRHALQAWEGHNVTTFISVAGPHMGVCKVPPMNGYQGFDNAINDTVAELCYNVAGQDLSFCNMWNDPTKQYSYRRHNKFLSASLCQTKTRKCPGNA